MLQLFQGRNDTQLRMMLQMQVNHGCFELTVSQQCFNDMDIIALIEQVRGKAVS